MSKIKNTHDRGIAIVYVMSIFLEKIEEHEIFIQNRFHKSKTEWNDETKSNLIVSIFNEYQFPSIVVAEIIKDDCAYLYVIDGIQRLNSFLDFKNNNLKINENSERAVVKYLKRVKNENNEVFFQVEEYDLRGKLYKDLPKEFQEEFDNYNLHIDLYSPCSEEDIIFHIKRYNSATE